MSDRIEELLRTGGGDGVGEAVERFLAKAEDGRLLDVAYARAESPFGDLLVAATPRGLVRVGFLHTMDEDAVLDELATRISPRVLRSPARLDEVRRQLDEYFDGRRRRFELRFGLGGREPTPLRETGRKLGISAERVRQIEEDALERLAESGDLASLRDAA